MLFIPQKLKVGFVERKDTYTKKLAFVIYYDEKGVLRKENRWESWRSKNIDPQEHLNEPTEGFVLNKGVGGARQSSGWNARNEYVRVYDPRGFEFEITVPNLLFILSNCDCSKGKGLEGKFVYAWEGTELALIPVNSQEYKNYQNFTNSLQKNVVVNTKKLIVGATYATKNQHILTYLGKFDYHDPISFQNNLVVKNKFVFWDKKQKEFLFFDDIKKNPQKHRPGHRQNCGAITALISEEVADNVAELTESYYKSKNGSKIARIFLKEIDDKENWFIQKGNSFIQFGFEYHNHHIYQDGKWVDNPAKTINYMNGRYSYTLKNGYLYSEFYEYNAYPNQKEGAPEKLGPYDRWNGRRQITKKIDKWIEPTNLGLFAEFESGSILKYSNSKLTFEE